MRILIVDQCSSAKKGKDRYEALDQETIDAETRDSILDKDGIAAYRAKELYQGRQQQRITEAVEILKDTGDEVARIFVSAGFGIVDEDDLLPLYDVTFADMTNTEIDSRAMKLGIHEDLREIVLGEDYDIIFFALGRDYYRCARIDELLPDVPAETFVVFFNREALEQEYENGLSLSARTTQAKLYGTIVIALKGEYLRNFATHRRAGKSVTDVDDIQEYCEEALSSQAGLDNYSKSS